MGITLRGNGNETDKRDISTLQGRGHFYLALTGNAGCNIRKRRMNNTKKKIITKARSAIDGQFTTLKYAKEHPNTTVIETTISPSKQHKKKSK